MARVTMEEAFVMRLKLNKSSECNERASPIHACLFFIANHKSEHIKGTFHGKQATTSSLLRAEWNNKQLFNGKILLPSNGSRNRQTKAEKHGNCRIIYEACPVRLLPDNY